jgi:hypothetical protein
MSHNVAGLVFPDVEKNTRPSSAKVEQSKKKNEAV